MFVFNSNQTDRWQIVNTVTRAVGRSACTHTHTQFHFGWFMALVVMTIVWRMGICDGLFGQWTILMWFHHFVYHIRRTTDFSSNRLAGWVRHKSPYPFISNMKKNRIWALSIRVGLSVWFVPHIIYSLWPNFIVTVRISTPAKTSLIYFPLRHKELCKAVFYVGYLNAVIDTWCIESGERQSKKEKKN